MTIIEPQE